MGFGWWFFFLITKALMEAAEWLKIFTLFQYFLYEMVFAFENGKSQVFSVAQKVNLSNFVRYKLF